MKTKLSLLATAALGALLMANPASAQSKLRVNICTGGEGKPYNLTGEYIAGFLKDSRNIDLRVVTSKGTWDNIERTVLGPQTPEAVESGEACQAFIGQPDGAVLLKRKNPAAAANLRIIGQGPREFLHVLCSKESGISDLYELAGDSSKSVALGSQGSGAWLIWQNFIAEDKSYGDVQVTPEEGAIALSSVSSNTTTCMLVPAALGNATMLQADNDFGDQLTLSGANDKDFNDAANIDGKPLYKWQEIPSGSYPANLQGWFSSKDTVAWTAGVYVNNRYFDGNQKALEELITAVAKAKPAIKNTFGTLE
jgi:TRAP-type uncharacterized transport system substrate-binding protein